MILINKSFRCLSLFSLLLSVVCFFSSCAFHSAESSVLNDNGSECRKVKTEKHEKKENVSFEKAKKNKDCYSSVEEIRASFRENADFRVKYELRHSSASVFAIHGGDIELGTSEMAILIAGEDWSYYLFEGIGADAKKYHITAARFDDMPAVKIAAASMLGISLHAQRGTGENICIGGGNSDAAALMANNLAEAGFDIEYPCRRLPGKSPRNIVNRTRLQGIQLEITQPLLDRLAADSEYSAKFAVMVRKAAESYLSSHASALQ